ncbi:MAG: aminopeptidase [Rhodanobacter sp.]
MHYYGQAVRGQARLIMHRRKIDAVISDPNTSPELARRLQLALRARHFATSELGLPDNRSYTTYVELHRPYVVWNVFATRSYSVDALAQCFLIAGCVAYRGWFSQSAAEADAARLRADGDDVWIGGVTAYSTLGWFADPVLSSMLQGEDTQLIGTIFHELSHQLIYVPGDTAFNESFATFVQGEGSRQWRTSQGLPAQVTCSQAHEQAFTVLVLDLRRRLKSLYASGAAPAALAAGKQREFAAFRQRYAQWRNPDWPDIRGYDAWVAAPLNNARLVPFGLYARWVPAFAQMFARSGHVWTTFYARVRALAGDARTQRDHQLQTLLSASGQRGPTTCTKS